MRPAGKGGEGGRRLTGHPCSPSCGVRAEILQIPADDPIFSCSVCCIGASPSPGPIPSPTSNHLHSIHVVNSANPFLVSLANRD